MILYFCPVILDFLVSDFWTELNDLRTLHPCVLSLHLSPIGLFLIVRSGQDMDSAESDPVRAVLQAQGQKLHHQEEQLAMVRREVADSSKNNKVV